MLNSHHDFAVLPISSLFKWSKKKSTGGSGSTADSPTQTPTAGSVSSPKASATVETGDEEALKVSSVNSNNSSGSFNHYLDGLRRNGGSMESDMRSLMISNSSSSNVNNVSSSNNSNNNNNNRVHQQFQQSNSRGSSSHHSLYPRRSMSFERDRKRISSSSYSTFGSGVAATAPPSNSVFEMNNALPSQLSLQSGSEYEYRHVSFDSLRNATSNTASNGASSSSVVSTSGLAITMGPQPALTAATITATAATTALLNDSLKATATTSHRQTISGPVLSTFAVRDPSNSDTREDISTTAASDHAGQYEHVSILHREHNQPQKSSSPPTPAAFAQQPLQTHSMSLQTSTSTSTSAPATEPHTPASTAANTTAVSGTPAYGAVPPYLHMGVQQRQQICNLATTMHSTAGEVPAPRAGASTTLIGNTVYVFGGYLTNELRITNDMYAIDLETLVWRRIGGSLMQADTWHNQPYLRPSGSQQPQPQQQPQPRYFHSATAYGKYIVIYGGLTMAVTQTAQTTQTQPQSPQSPKSPQSLSDHVEEFGSEQSDKQQSQPKQQVVQSVLGEIALFDTVTSQWTLIASPKTTEQLLESVGHPPPNRFAHLATLVSDKLLLVMGGQDSSNEFLNDFSVYDLENKEWICSAPVGKQVGMYRSTLIASSHAQRSYSSLAMRNSDSSATDEKDDNGNGKGDADVNVNVDVNYSATTCAESWKSCSGPDVLMYTTNNFSNVRRSLYLLASDDNWNITDLSSTMTGTTAMSYEWISSNPDSTSNSASSGPMPPGLRFPVAYVLGDSMIMAGSYFSSSVQGYVIWALDLRTNQWRFVDCLSNLSYPLSAADNIFADQSSATAPQRQYSVGSISPATMATSGSATASVSESWNRAVLCPSSACLYVFGDPRNDIMEDYNIRQLNFSHVSRIALDAHGLVPPPASASVARAMYPQLPLDVLPEITLETDTASLAAAVFEEQQFTDFTIVVPLPSLTGPMTSSASDNRRTSDATLSRDSPTMQPRSQAQQQQPQQQPLTDDSNQGASLFMMPVNSHVLRSRWPWFDSQFGSNDEWPHQKRELQIYQPPTVVYLFLKYLYTKTVDDYIVISDNVSENGQIQVPTAALARLLHLAADNQLWHLKDIVLGHLHARLSNPQAIVALHRSVQNAASEHESAANLSTDESIPAAMSSAASLPSSAATMSKRYLRSILEAAPIVYEAARETGHNGLSTRALLIMYEHRDILVRALLNPTGRPAGAAAAAAGSSPMTQPSTYWSPLSQVQRATLREILMYYPEVVSHQRKRSTSINSSIPSLVASSTRQPQQQQLPAQNNTPRLAANVNIKTPSLPASENITNRQSSPSVVSPKMA